MDFKLVHCSDLINELSPNIEVFLTRERSSFRSSTINEKTAVSRTSSQSIDQVRVIVLALNSLFVIVSRYIREFNVMWESERFRYVSNLQEHDNGMNMLTIQRILNNTRQQEWHKTQNIITRNSQKHAEYWHPKCSTHSIISSMYFRFVQVLNCIHTQDSTLINNFDSFCMPKKLYFATLCRFEPYQKSQNFRSSFFLTFTTLFLVL